MRNFNSKLLRQILAVLILLQSHVARPAEGVSPEPNWKESAFENLKSPITTNAKYALIVGAGLVGGLLVFEDQIIDPVQNRTSSEKPLGQYSKYGDLAGQGIPNALYILGMYGYGALNSENSSKQNASAMLHATLYSVASTTALKYTVREKRPDSDNRDLFRSGHWTGAFSFASYVGCRHSLGWGIAAYSLATFVGYSRINDNRHYLHDVVGGAAIGTAYGLGICLSENERATQIPGSVQKSWYVIPMDQGLGIGLNVHY